MLRATPSYNPNITAANFNLIDVISGTEITLYDQDLSYGFVIGFICNHCPYVQEIITEFVTIAEHLQNQGIPVFAIMSNNYQFVTLDSPENMKLFAQQHNFTFSYLIDENQSIAKKYNAICTPDFFGFNSDKKMQFRGRIQELQQSMLEIAKDGFTQINQSPSRGCSIKWK